MRLILAAVWLLTAEFSSAQMSWDLNSPFLQTALIEEKTGEITEKVVRKARIEGELIELEKEEGGLLVLPRRQLLALLPRLPQSGMSFLQKDAEDALEVLQGAQSKFPQRSEVSPAALAEWQRLALKRTEYDEVRSAALDQWLEKIGQVPIDAKPEDLEKIRQDGLMFVDQFPGRAEEIERALVGLGELRSIDLRKLDSVSLDFGALGENWILGVIFWALLILPLAAAFKGISQGLRSFREGLPRAGMVWLIVGGVAAGFLAALLLAEKEDRASPLLEEGLASSTSARRAGWFSLNGTEKWSNQPPKRIQLPASDWLAFLNEKARFGAGSDSFPFWYLASPRMLKTGSALILLQPLQANFITLPFRFDFHLPKTGQSLTGLELRGASIGKIPLGAFLGQLVWDSFQPAYQAFVEKCGLNQGVQWIAGEGETVVIQVPSVKRPKPTAKESLPAQELAEVFDQGFGEIYKGKVVTVEGALIAVSSRRETLGAGTGVAVSDSMDEFILQGIPEGPNRRFGLQVRCQFKSDDTYSLDTKGDLFMSKHAKAADTYSLGANGDLPKPKDNSQNPFAGIPVLRRHQGVTLVRMSAGRVESGPDEKRVVTLYDCRKAEGFEGGAWKTIWESATQPSH